MVISERRGSQVIADAALRQLAGRLRGRLLLPETPEYDAARTIFNATIDRHPVAIAQPADADDVVSALAFARTYDLPIAVKGGGHGSAGHSLVDNGLVIDMALMKGVHVDPERRIAKAQTGLRAGEYLAKLEPYGLVSPVGDASTTGIGGMTLGGGYGFLSGKHGLVIDNLVSVELVTAGGRKIRASAMEHPDLFWALKGGAGNFGVTTAYEFRLHPLEQVLAGMLVYPFARAVEILRFYRDFVATTPDELTMYAGVATMPDGMPIAVLMPVWSGDMAAGEEILAPLRALGPVVDMVGPQSYRQASSIADNFTPPGFGRDERWNVTRSLTDETIDTIVHYADPARSLGNAVVIKQLNGLARRVDPASAAFPHRDAPFSVLTAAQWPDPAMAPAYLAWSREVNAALAPAMTGVYVNASEDDAMSAVFGASYPRLVEVKNRYDPTNMFHGNVNIEPTIG